MVRYSLRARQEEIELLEYILKEFGEKKAKEVYQKIEKLLGEISVMPKMYRSSKKRENLRKCVLSKQTSIYYRIHKDYIEVVSFRVIEKIQSVLRHKSTAQSRPDTHTGRTRQIHTSRSVNRCSSVSSARLRSVKMQILTP